MIAERVAFEVRGRPFSALVAGEAGRPLVLLLHGFPEYAGAWEEIIPPLAARFRVVAPDQRGYGASWRPRGAEHYGVQDLAADALAMIERFGDGRAAAVVGHDWGASVAYALAFAAPGAVERLICINGVHPVPFQEALATGGPQAEASRYIAWLRAEGSEQKLAAGGFEKLARLFGEGMDLSWLTPERRRTYEAAWRDADGLGAMIDWYRASPLVVPPPGERVALPDWARATYPVRMPHLVIWGMDDAVFVPELRRGAEPYSDHFVLEEIEGADHWVCHQRPERVSGRILAFLSEAPS